MAEGPDQTEISPQVRLLARMRLQRVVFGVLACVLVTGAALGLAAYRRMQSALVEAERATDSARTDVAEGARRIEEMERQRARARDEAEALSRGLGLSCARLAVQEARAGFRDRAAGLVQDSLRYGAPAWLPVAAAASRDNALRFRGSLHPESPIACGHATPDGSRLVVARNVPGACVLEVYDGLDGALVASGSPALAADRQAPIAEALLLSPQGKAFVLAVQGRLFQGEVAGSALKFEELPGPGARVLHMSASVDFGTLLVSRGRDGLFQLSRVGSQWTSKAVPLPGGEARAAAFGGPGEVFAADSKFVYMAGGDAAFAQVADLSFEPESLRITAAGGGMAVCARTSNQIEYFIIETPGLRVRQRLRQDLPARADGSLQLLQDGTALSGVGGGRVLQFRGAQPTEFNLGGYGPTFAAWHAWGMLFGNSQGDVGLRVAGVDAGPGRPLAVLAPQLSARAQPFGFVTSSPDGDRAAWLVGTGLVGLPGASRVWLAGGQIALTAGESTAFLDASVPVAGSLLGAGTGGALLWREGAKLVVARPNGESRPLDCAATNPPDDVAVSADFSAAVLRWQNTLYLTDLRSDPRPLARRGEFNTDLFCLSADGDVLALASGAAIVVRDLGTGSERSLLAASPPRALALLYGGTVVASAEAESLALYEVDGGRELARFSGAVDSLAATPDDALLLVCDGTLRRLGFQGR